MDGPEPYTNEWYRRRLGRIDTNLDRQDNELKDQWDRANELRHRLEVLETQRREDVAIIGELIGKVEVLTARLDEAGRVVGGMKKRLEEMSSAVT